MGFKLPATTSSALVDFLYYISGARNGNTTAFHGNAKIKRMRAISFCAFRSGLQEENHLKCLYLYQARSTYATRTWRFSLQSVHVSDINKPYGNHGSRWRVVYEASRAKNEHFGKWRGVAARSLDTGMNFRNVHAVRH